MKQKRLISFLLAALLCAILTVPVSAVPCYETPEDGCDTLRELIAQSDDPNALFEVEVILKYYKKETLNQYTQQASQTVQKEIEAGKSVSAQKEMGKLRFVETLDLSGRKEE